MFVRYDLEFSHRHHICNCRYVICTYVGMIHLHTKLHVFSHSRVLIMEFKSKIKCLFRTVAMLLYYVLRNIGALLIN
jgi:hypothetical protein